MAQRMDLYRLLNGLITLYKPPKFSLDKLVRLFRKKIASEFNQLHSTEPVLSRTVLHTLKGEPNCKEIRNVELKIVPDIVDTELILGQRFTPSDFVIFPIDPLDDHCSGVQVLGIGERGVYEQADRFIKQDWLKIYRLTGELGRASTDGLSTSPTLLRSSWRHVTREKLDRALNVYLTKFSSSILLKAKLRPNSLKAYEALARRSFNSQSNVNEVVAHAVPKLTRLEDLLDERHNHLLSPWERYPVDFHQRRRNRDAKSNRKSSEEEDRQSQSPYVSLLRCVEFNPPHFVVEIHVAHETFEFLVNFMASLGPHLRSTTVLRYARRIQHGPLVLRDSLLLKQCTVPSSLLDRYNSYISSELQQTCPKLVTDNAFDPLQIICGSHEFSNFSCVNDVNLFRNLYTCSRSNLAPDDV